MNLTKSSPNQSLLGAAMALRRTTIREGRPFPLGATWDGLGVNFALFSAHATRVELCIFDDAGEKEIERFDLPEYTDEVWHGYVPDRAARHRLRLSRSRALRAGCRPPVQSEQAVDRSLCPAAGRRVAVGSSELFGYRLDHPTRTNPTTNATARRNAQVPGHRSGLYLGSLSASRRRRGRAPSFTRCTSRDSRSVIR